MQVSAITVKNGNGYKFSSNMPYYNTRTTETIGDTAFNSLTPYSNSRKAVSSEELPQVYANIAEWQNFCHNQILGNKFNVIA